MKTSNKARGAWSSVAIQNLKASGLTGETLEKAIAAVKFGFKSTPKVLKIPRPVAKRIGEVLARDKRVVVIVMKKGGLGVFTYEGYNIRVAHPGKHMIRKGGVTEPQPEAVPA